ncbi:MAG: hypothetical protein UR23_C0037G0010 [Candidatus Roizmanbacteria bacterium GW2011_GWA2_32_13]|uniref:Uncharacterized protein n=1 Tax=Candidatus Roizmanbacteria bacterium GW2011_GWA2_32_13 TaxID=1618475 RepID=A0A0F9YSJ8_9BACT|nr:MAG: hypothetical protein UR23_C0037G0010 [Candidatus Roizmanbacteria bacterium GW2011_GWA2_32_13]
MDDQNLIIKCPHCGEEISIQDALSHQVKKTISAKKIYYQMKKRILNWKNKDR